MPKKVVIEKELIGRKYDSRLKLVAGDTKSRVNRNLFVLLIIEKEISKISPILKKVKWDLNLLYNSLQANAKMFILF